MNAATFQRNTRQRQVILEELQKLSSHPTAAVLHTIVRRYLPKISLGTVYRNLELLARKGQIQKLEFAGAEARFDGNIARHDHLRCVRCGRVDDVSAAPLDLFQGTANDWGGYEILGHRLEFYGLCPQCKGWQEEQRRREKGDRFALPERPAGCFAQSEPVPLFSPGSTTTPNPDDILIPQKPR